MAVQSHCLAFARTVRVSFDQVVEYFKDMPVGYASRRLRQGHTVSCALRDRAHGPCLLLQPCLWAVFALCRACVPSLVGRRPGICPTSCRACVPRLSGRGLGSVPIPLVLYPGCVPVFYGFYYCLFCGGGLLPTPPSGACSTRVLTP